jgi:hypothetical protein
MTYDMNTALLDRLAVHVKSPENSPENFLTIFPYAQIAALESQCAASSKAVSAMEALKKSVEDIRMAAAQREARLKPRK